MKNSWLVWVFITGVVITVLVAFNYQGNQTDSVSLSEIFPEDEQYSAAADYEFVDEAGTAEVATETIRKVQVEQPKEEIPKIVKAEPKQEIQKATETSVKTIQNQNATVPTITDLKKIPYTIQAASFKDKANADEVAAKMRDKGYLAFVVGRDLGSKGTWYRVYVGEFDTKTEADTSLTEVKKQYKDSFIISIAPLK